MNYEINASATANDDGEINIKETHIAFGTTAKTSNSLANPAELFLSSFAACILKNVERFSKMMKFQYSKAEILVKAVRHEKPPRMDDVTYVLTIFSNDPHLNTDLLKKNIEKFGTIYNTVKASCSISGDINSASE